MSIPEAPDCGGLVCPPNRCGCAIDAGVLPVQVDARSSDHVWIDYPSRGEVSAPGYRP
jgi:hypothetical protein